MELHLYDVVPFEGLTACDYEIAIPHLVRACIYCWTNVPYLHTRTGIFVVTISADLERLAPISAARVGGFMSFAIVVISSCSSIRMRIILLLLRERLMIDPFPVGIHSIPDLLLAFARRNDFPLHSFRIFIISDAIARREAKCHREEIIALVYLWSSH